MATYFHGSSEIQADGLQTLYLMNPNYVGYSDTHPPQPANMLFFNSATGDAPNTASIPHAPPSHNQFMVAVSNLATTSTIGSPNSEEPNRLSVHTQHEIPSLHGFVPRFHYNLWGSEDQTGPRSHPTVAVSNSGGGGTTDIALQLGFRQPALSPVQKGLSLSLSPQPPGYRFLSTDHEIPMQNPVGMISPGAGDDIRASGCSSSSVSVVSNGFSSIQTTILGSRYLKAAQQLLDEVANVGERNKNETGEGSKEKLKMKMKMKKESMAVAGETRSGEESRAKGVAELTTAQRQELQMKKAKLVSMLDEVEQRYRHYHHQMQIVVASFEQASGFGSAKSYTALALQTISKQFRCLKDSITAQIKATTKSLGEEESLGGKVEVSRLKFVDHQLQQQQRSLQQLGMVQHNNSAWRPQRGLPQRAVSFLRAWLFEHFLHPYPKDADKQMLAKQAGLTKSQVSNWFINARVRLWKPMVEDMYMEEFKGQEHTVSEDNRTHSEPTKVSVSKSTAPQASSAIAMDQSISLQSKKDKKIDHKSLPTELSNSNLTKSTTGGSLQAQTGFAFIGSPNLDGMVQRNPKKPKNSDKTQNSPSSILSTDIEPNLSNKAIHEKFGDYPLMAGTTGNGGGFGTYPIGELRMFDAEQLALRFHGNGVSLSLGLPHSESLSLTRGHQNYLSNQNIQLGTGLEMGTVEAHYNAIGSPQASQTNNGYENINTQNRNRFSAQLLPDFVT
ncbi:unnamed protein product [Ilex paraguariensis]|uniref:Homeobox domain-containing protein n=1 Tax=Ilex paraguariensis TaxID=185542 RepID=A0ABC8UVB4_9AQUA